MRRDRSDFRGPQAGARKLATWTLGALALSVVTSLAACDKDDEETTGDATTVASTGAEGSSGGSTAAESTGGSLQMYSNCGDPVCGTYGGPFDGVPLCSDLGVSAGDPCDDESFSCDPVSDCNNLLVCAASDPTMSEGGCPISRRDRKRDIHYLNDAELERAADELMKLRLATYRYRGARDLDRAHLGVILEDGAERATHGLWADEAHDRVDLYGYASLAIATAQLQARELETLRGELALMRARLGELESARCEPTKARVPRGR